MAVGGVLNNSATRTERRYSLQNRLAIKIRWQGELAPSYDHSHQPSRRLGSRDSSSVDRLWMVHIVWQPVAELSRQDHDRHRTNAQCCPLCNRDCCFDLRELCPGLVDRATGRPQRSLRLEDRLALLVLFSLCRVCNYLSVLCV